MKLSQRHVYKIYCSEPIDKIEHYEKALAENFKGWCIHHRLEIQPDGTRMSRQELKGKDLYFNRPASELVFMRCEEHTSLHMRGKPTWNKGKHHSADTRRKMSESLRGKHPSAETRLKMSESKKGEKNPLFGKHHSAETRQKMSESLSGENNPFFGKHLSAETRKKISESRKGKKLGVHWWNDGVSCKLAKECPGEGWTRGRLRFK